MRLASLAISLLLCAVASAQIESSAETLYVVSGLDNPQTFGSTILVDATSKPVVKPAGLVTIETDAAMITVKASDSKRNPVIVQRIDAAKFLVLGQGRLWVDITCIDFEKQFFDQSQIVIDVGDAPEPDEPDEPDDPEPDNPDTVPEDEFDNLGQRVAAACEAGNLQFDTRGRVAEVYEKVAADMESFEIKRTMDAVRRLQFGITGLSLGPEWQKVFDLLAEDGKTRPALGWEQTIAWYRAAATGFKGQ